MPIEIKELHIRVTVNAPQGVQQAGVKPVRAGNLNADEDNDKEAIVAECLEQIMEILKNKKER